MIHRFACSTVPSRILAFLIFSSLPAVAQVPDLTAGGTPTTTKTLNLGPTGAKGWLYHVNENSGLSRQILVKTVEAGSPSAGILAAGDVILGADGTGANPVNFTSDARKALGLAIADAEARNPAELKVLRWRSGVTTTETITLQTMGAYSATAPYNCPKSALILAQGLDYVMANQDSGNMKMGLLALLAANNPADPDNAARLARAQADALSLMPTQAQINDMLAGKVSTESKIAWSVGHKLLVLSEYYLATGDAQVLPGIEAFAVAVANGQSALGTMGHQFTSPGPDGSVNGTYNVGYGCVNSAGMPAFLGLLLARECGIDNPEIEPAIARASRFFAAYTDYGAHPYGEHEPYRQAHESNGKSGLAAICFSLLENRAEEQGFYAKMATAAPSERGVGHTGPWFNYLWSPLGAAAGGEEAAALHFSRISWDLDLSRRWDGGFDFNNLYGQGGDGGTPGWQSNFHMYTAALLTYALPHRQLVITGKNPDTERWLDTNDVAEAAFADEYNAAARTTPELVADLGSFSPKVQYYAAKQLGLRTAEHATLVPQLIAIANDTNAGEQRVGACFALGDIKNGSAAVHLANLLTDADPEVRFASAEALRYLPQANRLAQVNTIMAATASTAKPFYPIDEEDPIHFAHHRLCMLLFYGGTAYGPKGVIWGNSLNGIDRNLLYPAIEAVAANPNGQARSTLGSTYPYLTEADVNAVAGALVDSVKVRAPADKMFSGGVRTGGLSTLQKFNIAEGVPLSRIIAADKTLNSERNHALDVLALYAGDSTLVNPDPKIAEFCEFLVFTAPTLAADAQQVLDAIVADASPTAPRAFKSIQSISVENPSLTLPAKSTRLHVIANDFADGDSIYTWRKVHGAGRVTFIPNSSGAANNTTVLFDGTPGKYLFEVTMSDSRGLTEAVETVEVTLYQSGGGLPPNDPPVATTQNLTIPQSTTTPIVLTGTDPEGHALNYAVTGEPSHGKLSGTAPYLTYTSDFGYTGADSFTFEVMDSEGQTATATINLTIDPIAGLQTAIYEPFDYAAGLLNGKSGSSEVGLTGTWAAQTSSAYITAGSLTYGSLSTLGGKFEPTGASNHWGGTRSISSSALAANGLLNDGATLWFSAVVGYGTANTTNARLSVALANSGFSTGNFDYWIRNEGAQLGSGVGFTLGRHDGANGRVKATQFRDLASGDGFAGNIDGTWEGNGAAYTSNQHGLIVCRITWADDPEQPDTIEVFQPLTNLELPGAPISVLNAVLDQSTFDTLTFSRGDYVRLDEIRFGPNYHSVLVGNQPLTADISAPVPNPVGFHTAPVAVNGTSITMQAATAYDPSGVEYYFTCTSGGGNDSGWQSSPNYTDSGLTPGVEYSYTVKARDLSPARNETTPSPVASATLPTSLAVPDVTGMDQATAEAVISAYSFTVGTVGTAYSPTVPEGGVISQSPAGDSNAAVGSAVNLVVSLGIQVNEPPVWGANPIAGADASEGIAYVGSLAASASDANAGDVLAFVKVGGPAWLTVAADGTLGGTPGQGDVGPNVFTVTVSDGIAAPVEAALHITVIDTNDAPVFTSNTIASADATEDLAYSGSLAGSATDADDDTLTYAKVSGPAWLGVAANGTLSGTPGSSAVGQNAFTVSVTDGIAAPVNATLNITVLSQPDVLSIVDNQAGGTVFETQAFAYTVTFDEAINPATLDAGDFSNATGVAPAVNAIAATSNPAVFTVHVTPGGAGTLTLQIAAGAVIQNLAGTALDTTSAVSDDTTLTVEAGSGPVRGTITVDATASGNASSGTLSGTLNASGSDKLVVVVTGEHGFPGNLGGNCSSVTYDGVPLTRIVDRNPIGGTPIDQTFNDIWYLDNPSTSTGAIVATVASRGSVTAFALSGTAPGAGQVAVSPQASKSVVLSTSSANSIVIASHGMGGDGNTANVANVNTVAPLIETSARANSLYDGHVTAYAQVASSGTASYAFTGGNLVGSHTIAAEFIAAEGNNAPQWLNSPVVEASASEDANYASTLANDASDADGDTLAFAKLGGPAWLNIAADGTLSGTPANADVGVNVFSVSVTDNKSPAVEAVLSITVTNTNDAPVFAADPIAGGDATEDAAYAGTLAGSASDDDADAALSYAKAGGPAWLSVAADGTLSGTPSGADVGPNTFTVSVDDGNGGSDTATLNIEVINVNDAPVFISGSLDGGSATEDIAYSGTLAGNASDDDNNNLVFSKVSGPPWLAVAPDGTLSGTPANADVGPNTFTVSVSDAIAAPVEAALHITVININDAPVWAGNPITGGNASEDEPYSGSIASSASDEDAGGSLSFAKIEGPAWLSVAANGALTGTPANSDVGTGIFTVSVSDGIAPPATTTLIITVTNTNDAPVWTNNPVTGAGASEGTAYVGQTLAGQATDADEGDSITFSKVSGPAWLAVAPDGTLSGTPPTGSAGPNTFVVRATDTASAAADATLAIDVGGLPLPWVTTDIGTGMLAGSVVHDAGTFTQAGSGTIGGTSDRFRFTYQALSGDGEITARISSLQNTGTSSRVGVMIRESLAANSKQVFAGMTGSNAYRWTRRTTTGGNTSNSSYGTGTVPNTWVRIVRSGNTFTTYKSANGTSWTNMGSITMTFASSCYIGLAVGSGSNTTLNTSQFSNVSVTP